MMFRGAAPQTNFYTQQQGMMNNDDSYLPEEPVLLTDYEEQRLSEQVRVQLGSPTIIDRLKLFYQELAKYDPNVTSHVHYSNIQMVASQLGVISSGVPIDPFAQEILLFSFSVKFRRGHTPLCDV